MTALLPNRMSRALGKARAEVNRLEQAVTRWESDAAVKLAALADLEAGAGDAVLADESGTVARQLAVDAQELRFGIDGAHRAADAAQRQLRAARWTVADAEAVQLREQAATVRAEAVKRQARVDELVQALVDYEAGDWRLFEPPPGSFGMVVAEPPRTPRMFAEADQLDAQAQVIEDRVAAERRQAAVLVPAAEIHFTPDLLDKGNATAAVSASVNDGVGALEFEVVRDGGQVVESFGLPDAAGRRGWRKLVDVFDGQTLTVRAGGNVLASRLFESPPGSAPNRSHPLSIR